MYLQSRDMVGTHKQTGRDMYLQSRDTGRDMYSQRRHTGRDTQTGNNILAILCRFVSSNETNKLDLRRDKEMQQ